MRFSWHVKSGQDRKKEGDADVAVDIEESQIEVREVMWADQPVFPYQESGHDDQTDPIRPGKRDRDPQPDQQADGDDMANCREGEGEANPESCRDGLYMVLLVEFDVLTGVDQVKTSDPECDHSKENPGRNVSQGKQRLAHPNPGSDRRKAVGETQDEMGEPSKALGEGIADQKDECSGKQFQSQRTKRPGSQNKDSASDYCPDPGGGDWNPPGDQRAIRRAWVERIQPAVSQAVCAHRQRARRRHCDRDPEECLPGWPAAGGQEHSQVSERQGENRMLEFDQFQEVTNAFHRYFMINGLGTRITSALRFYPTGRCQAQNRLSSQSTPK